MTICKQASKFASYLVHIAGAVDIFGAYGAAEPAGNGKGPSRDGKNGTIAEEGGELVSLQRGRHHHDVQRDRASFGAHIIIKEGFL